MNQAQALGSFILMLKCYRHHHHHYHHHHNGNDKHNIVFVCNKLTTKSTMVTGKRKLLSNFSFIYILYMCLQDVWNTNGDKINVFFACFFQKKQ